MPATPAETKLYVIGPDPRHGYWTAEVANAANALRAMGYQVKTQEDTMGRPPAGLISTSDGIARTEHWYESLERSKEVNLAEALDLPVLSVAGWVRAASSTSPGGWYGDLFA